MRVVHTVRDIRGLAFSLPLFKKYEHSVTVATLDGAAPDESEEENENTTKEQAEEDGEKPKKKKPAILKY